MIDSHGRTEISKRLIHFLRNRDSKGFKKKQQVVKIAEEGEVACHKTSELMPLPERHDTYELKINKLS